MIIGSSSGGKTETLRMVDALADERVDELTAALLLSWSKGKNPRPTRRRERRSVEQRATA
jgi:hypothetical protein